MRVLVRQVGGGLGEAVLAAAVAAVVAAVGLVAFGTVQWPAFNSSNVTRALTTVGQVASVVVLIAAVVLIRLRRWPWLAKVLSWAGISSFVTVTLGMPLGATKLYLFGVSVDQEFRTEYLTRLTDSAALHDMTYIDLPPYYPAGWFWIGGRVANLLGMPGWEAFKPYAIGSLAVAAALALVLWSKLIRADWAVAVAAATTAVTVAFASPEAYSAVLVVLFAPAMILAWGALYRPAEWTGADRSASARDAGSTDAESGAGMSADRSAAQGVADGAVPTAGGWGAVIGAGLFLGLAAMFYQLFAAVAVFTVVLMAVVAWGSLLWQRRADAVHQPRQAASGPSALQLLWPILARLVVMGVITGVLALITWGPWLWKALTSSLPKSGGSALHYLPEPGARLSFPMFDFAEPLLGLLCLIGTVWLVLRAASSRRAQALGIGVVAIYLWSLASMAVTAVGMTALSFRLEPILQVLLAAAGVFGFVEGARAVYQALNEPQRFRVVTAAVAALAALAFAQTIPSILNTEITTAYTDTDGNGERADQRSPSAVSHYREIDAALTAQTGRPRDASVVLTADTSFLAYYPYYGFQALTSHYANPLADFAGRSAEIKRWSGLQSPAELLDALAHSPWRAPDAFVFRRSGDSYTLRLAEDVYPNDPNVRRYTVSFPKTLFEDPHFRLTEIGPFTVVVRH
ncbi:galactan 5-O-arabinofuranosyltransferase [Nocardia mexicana]|uniref:Galactan 5-O-arabinofuranosyltransferase n=1 Tax=Nocardia mexicana TaxID=279262 RepID=A0A370GXU0_9NOCA|nr:galactan 5-O-arabinofuranosyltransferase [Nocardia mexicana]RDI48477.1 galactan 5-O-arabinofuranosyltransferase [Nocardia mexicana]